MLSVSVVILAKNFPSWLHLRTNMCHYHIYSSDCRSNKCESTAEANGIFTTRKKRAQSTDLNMGQCAELSQWKPLFFCPVRMSQMMMACGSSLVSISGLKVTTYLEGTETTHGASDDSETKQFI